MQHAALDRSEGAISTSSVLANRSWLRATRRRPRLVSPKTPQRPGAITVGARWCSPRPATFVTPTAQSTYTASTPTANTPNRARKHQSRVAGWFSSKPSEVGHKRTEWPAGHEYACGQDREGIGEKRQSP